MASTPDPFFAEQLLHWYAQHHRDLPWRHTQNPYLIWLSEIMLQQTRVAQGLPYYVKFAENYPTVQDLAAAPEDEVLRLWQGLGYYSRARNMQQTARQISGEQNGIFPNNYTNLLKLKGIGTYTAAAIASFAFNERVAVLDGNVYRVLARYFGIQANIAAPSSKKIFQEVAQQQLPERNSSRYNQAIMEFGALHCTPRSPACATCLLQQGCYAFLHGLQGQLPVKEKAKKMRVRHFTYLVFELNQQVYMRKRLAGDIWQGLYDFPLIETEEPLLEGGLFSEQKLSAFVPSGAALHTVSAELRHQLSHQQVRAHFCHIKLTRELPSELRNQWNCALLPLQTIEEIGKPMLIDRYLKSAGF